MIRLFQPSDLEPMVAIAKKAWKKIFEGFRQQLGDELYSILYDNRLQDKRHQLTEWTRKFPDQCIVCERNGKVVGFATFSFSKETKIGLLLNNAADPDSGEKGVGQEMYASVFERMRQEGMIAVTVSTGLDEGHAPARRAYERAGFKKNLKSITYCKKL